ncbi:hypothetical protein [Chitinophaga barathri]|uniref:Uncharacterized protein n=1 Tax=Chitinophaga barathri TaxID=1647451 RepID=A0A3N4M6J4_9BACT|nr:hypothetical protein [Chitinophaga barathri]RPD39004.1 hypothetical protein EG028_22975 [Chitinophaga barathri]
MKIRSPFVILFVLLLAGAGTFLACRKEKTHTGQEKSTAPLFDEKAARKHFYKSIRPSMEQRNAAKPGKTSKLYPMWAKAKTYTTGEYQIVEVPAYWGNRQLLTARQSTRKDTAGRAAPAMGDLGNFDRLIMYMDKDGRITERIVSFVPDAAYMARHNHDASHNTLKKLDKDFSGFLVNRTVDGNPYSLLKVRGGRVVAKMKISKNMKLPQRDPNARWEEQCEITEVIEIWSQDCIYIMVDEPGQGYVEYEECSDWYLDYLIIVEECEMVWVEDDPCWEDPSNPACNPGGGGGEEPEEPENPPSGPVPSLRHYQPGNPVTNLTTYLSHFNTSYDAKVTIYVDQPVPGTRNTSSGYDMGHTFITIEQDINGTIVRRSLGLFPDVSVNVFSPSTQSVIGNTEGNSYDAKLDAYISGYQLQLLLDVINNSPSMDFNMNSYNCSTFGIECIREVGVTVPYTIGNWSGGSGCNAGDTGEDIKSFFGGSASSGSAPANAG